MAGTLVVSKTGAQDIDGLLVGLKWDAVNLTYSFPTLASQYEYDDGSPGSFSRFAESQKDFARYALNLISSVCLLNFAEVSPADSGGDLRFANSNNPPTAYAYTPSSAAQGGDMWFGSAYDYKTPFLGSYAGHTYLHELGHAVGLKHGHESGNFGEMTYDHDAMEYTVMTYRSFVGDDITGYDNGSESYAQTLMRYDILALQHLYGTNYSYHSNDSVYTFDSASGRMFVNGAGQRDDMGNKIFRTVWDGGGHDTYDLSNYTVATKIDLSPEGGVRIFDTDSTQLAHLGYTVDGPKWASLNVYNAFNGDKRSLIENASGGSAGDQLIGNGLDNILHGNPGEDWLLGNEGNDSLVGGGGNDRIEGGEGAGDIAIAGGMTTDWIYFLHSDDSITFKHRTSDEQDTFVGVEFFQFGSEAKQWTAAELLALHVPQEPDPQEPEPPKPEEPKLPDPPKPPLTPRLPPETSDFDGNHRNNTIYGNSNDNVLNGFGGNDKLYGRTGNDVLIGGNGIDQLWGSTGRDTYIFDNKPHATRNYDLLRDFNVRDDTIALDRTYFKLSGSDLSKAAFHKGTAAHDRSDRVIYNQKTGVLSYDADGTGKAAAVKFAVVTNKVGLTYHDFDIV
jgi:serralysin